MKLPSIAVHAGDRKSRQGFVPATTPIHTSTTYFYDTAAELEAVFAGEADGPSYSRYGGPTVDALHEQVVALEGGGTACSTSSGMSALHIALLTALTDRPKRIVASSVLFGQTYLLLSAVLEQQGVETRFADPCDRERFDQVVADFQPGCILIEAVSNPLMRVTPIDKVVEVAKAHQAVVVADCTFTTPVLLRALGLGVDLVVYSATKYLAGHADVLGGIVVATDEHAAIMTALSRTLGPNLGPFESYLTMRGIKTLPLRVEAQCRNALRVANALAADPRVERVHYPGLKAHTDVELAGRLLSRAENGDPQFGAMVSFEIENAGREEIFRYIDALKLVVRTLSLGDVHSLISYPAISSHRSLSPKHRARLGIRDNLVRLSVGIEDADDIVEDLIEALGSV